MLELREAASPPEERTETPAEHEEAPNAAPRHLHVVADPQPVPDLAPPPSADEALPGVFALLRRRFADQRAALQRQAEGGHESRR